MEHGCPEDMVKIPGSMACIDRFEWPNQQGVKPLVGLSAIPSPWDVKRGITMDARSLCSSVGKRMCRMEEWIPSCKGKNGAEYPFGRKLPKISDPKEAPCNYAKWFRTTDHKKIFVRDPIEMGRLNQGDPSGLRGCVSGSGAEDMMGNVEEWIECPAWLSYNCDGTGKEKVCYCLAGRYWSSPASCDKMVSGHDPAFFDYNLGTRCCSELL